MWKPRPAKWLLWAPPMVVLTSLAAHLLNSGALNRDISTRAVDQLGAIGADWAKPKFDGRDAILGGDAPSQEAIDSAVKALAGVYGVRTVSTGARIVAPVALVAPTINPLIANSPTPEIKGTWQEGVAKTLAVTLAGNVFSLGTNPELTSNAGAWVLKPSTNLADGSYDVTAEVSDGANPPVETTTPTKILVDTMAPAAPVIAPPASGSKWPYTLIGTWAEGDATSLVAKLAGHIWTLGKDEALTSDGKGNWSFAPVVDLAPGSYDVTLETTDYAGNTSTATAANAIMISAAKPSGAAAIPTPIVPKTSAAVSPTVSLYASDASPAVVIGTWAEGNALGLKVSVPKAGLAAALGDGSGALVSDGEGNWSLGVSKPLEPGSYDVIAEEVDGAGRKSFDQTKFELNIKAPVASAAAVATPAATVAGQNPPTITLFSGEQSPASIRGTWDEAHAANLRVSIPGANLTALLGSDAALSSAQGVWTLALSQGLSPGIYNVVAESTDATGKAVADQTTAEIYVKTPLPPQAYDCAGILTKISTIFPLRFEFNGTQLKPPLDVAVNQYAALLKDQRCATMKAEIAGHADFFGPRLYNQALSEWRAQSVVSALVAAGVDASRLSTKGFSESVPLDSEKTIAARKKNRRVEITLVK